MPVHCDTCGFDFPSRGLRIGGNVTINIGRYTENCPRCNGRASVRDGRYDFVGGAVASVGPYEPDALIRFRALMEAAHAGGATADAVVAEAETLSPEFGKLVATVQALGGLPLLVALVAVWLQLSAMQSDNADQDAVLAELRESNAHQEEIIASLRELIETQGTAEPPPYSPQRQGTNHTRPIAASGPDRAARRRAWKQAKTASGGDSIKFQG